MNARAEQLASQLSNEHKDSLRYIKKKLILHKNRHVAFWACERRGKDLPSGQGMRVISSESSNTPFIPASMRRLLCFVGDKHLKPLNESINPDGGKSHENGYIFRNRLDNVKILKCSSNRSLQKTFIT